MKKLFTTLILVFAAVLLVSCGDKVEEADKKYHPITVKAGKEVAKPEDPTREGFVFKGYYTSRRGHHWLELEPVKFPFTSDEDMTLYAYFEPENSATANWSDGETYVSSMTSSSRLILNPLEYEWSHETDMIDMMVAPLYSTEVDWDLAIEEGIADAWGDFSKIVAQEYSIEALDYHYILVGATAYPTNEDGESAVDENGVYDRDLARDIMGTEWTYQIREDLRFEDGTPITAETFEFTLRNWLDPVQNNYRANMWYRTTENKNGRPVLNAFEYYDEQEGVEWEDVGFEVIDSHTFKITTFEEITQADAVGMGNDLRLVHPAKYTASMDEASGKSQYGTPAHRYMSYGPMVMKSWDENAKIVFNKNFDYVLKGTINYKSQVIEIVADVHEQYNLFQDGRLSVLGLTKDYYAEYAEDPRVKDSWNNFPQYIIVNVSDSKLGEQGHKSPTIINDNRFRQALLFGFDRKHFAYNVYAPNKPTLMPIPDNSKNYTYDPIRYTESQAHLDLLESLGIDPEDYGHDREKAVGLFDEAYADWLEEGNEGPVTLKYVTDDDEFSISLDEYIKTSLESLFEKDGEKRLVIDIVNLAPAGLEQAQINLDFDLMLTALGFGHAANAYWQYAAIALFPALIGASGFGLNYPYVGGPDEEGNVAMDTIISEEIRVEFANTFEFLSSIEEEELTAAQANFLALLDEEGVYEGELLDLALYILGSNPAVNMFWASPEEPFAGASEDLHALTAEFERLFLEYAPVIPTVTRAGSTLYADNVQIDWPEYSETFGWGAARYRFLTTDRDFYTE